jgi:hypothetical protein
MHQRNIAHAISPAVVVLTATDEVKVPDFGSLTARPRPWVGGEPTIGGAGANSTAAYASAERVTHASRSPRRRL